MTKEMTIAEICKVLGYDVKVVKEQEKSEPYQFKAGDVVECEWGTGDTPYRLIVQPQYTEGLIAVDTHGKRRGSDKSAKNFAGCGYKKLGELKAFLVKGQI